MSMYTTFKTYHETIKYLQTVDHPQCFTVNYLPNTNEYTLWIGNQPYYWIEQEEEKVKEERKKNLILKDELVEAHLRIKRLLLKEEND